MYVCMYLHMFVCLYVCMSVCTYRFMYVCIHACMYIFVCLYACMHACMYICIYVYMYVCVYVFIYVYFYICIYVYMTVEKSEVCINHKLHVVILSHQQRQTSVTPSPQPTICENIVNTNKIRYELHQLRCNSCSPLLV